ncbi:MAG: hypothetical protein IPM85_03755 [Chitinophagaceae bacterium]|nr:hypothetical protein [Chitinophagaceae bacterium]
MSPSQIIILLLVKIMAGIFYGWIGTYYGGLAQMYDTWNYHSLSIHEYNLLFKDPASYLANLFHNPYDNGLNNFFSSSNSYWNDLKSNVFIKLLSVFNIFTFGNYYVNVILYSFLTLFGPIALFRVMSDAFPEKRTTVLLFTFIIPSFLFWTSGLGKEGLLFAGIGMLIYSVYFGLKERKCGIIRIINIIICTLIILTFRNFVLVLLIPAVLVWIIANRRPEKAKLIFSVAYLFFAIIFFSARYLSPSLDFPKAVVNKQKEFLQIVGASSVPITELEPTVKSYIVNTPQAISLSTLRPYMGDVKHILSLAAALEISAILIIFVLFLFFRKNGIENKAFLLFCLFLSFSILLSIGYSQSNLGAIVRYRSIILPLFVIPFAALTDWNRITNIIKKYIYK